MLARIHVACLAAAVALSVLVADPRAAYAQNNQEAEDRDIPPDFKGMVGLGLIGAELGFVIPALAGLHQTWAFIVFPVVGAGGGAAAGYFLLEKGDGEPELAVASLTVGMAMVIPTIIITLSATAYEPEAAGELADLRNPGFVRLSDRGVRVAAPMVSVRSGVSARESLRTGVSMAREVHVPVLSGKF